jgi:glutathione S-transferase
VLFGRSSSHFTRVARMFAVEMGIAYELHVVRDLASQNVDEFGGNPALRIPVLRLGDDSWFGSLNVCRVFARSSKRPIQIVWPEDLSEPLLSNAQELILQGMATEVTLIMARSGGGGERPQQASSP